MMKEAWWSALFATALGLLLLGYVRSEPKQWAHYTDPIVYLCGAEALAEGHGYRFVPYVNQPRIGCHPPLQAAYLSLFWRLNPKFPDNIGLLYGAMILSVGVTFTLFYILARRSGAPAWFAIGTAMAWGLATPWGTLVYSFMSDISFGALWLGVGLCWVRNPEPDDWRRWLVTGLLLALMYLTRTATMPLLAAAVAILGWRLRGGRFRNRNDWQCALAFLVPVMIAGLGWKVWATGAPGYLDYLVFRVEQQGGFLGVLRCVGDNALQYLTGLGFLRSLFPELMSAPAAGGISTTFWSPLLTVTLMCAGWAFTACWVHGCWNCGSRVDRAGGFMVAAYLAQLIIYPVDLSERCLFAPLPFILIWAWKGRGLLTRWLPQPRVARALAAGAFLLSMIAWNLNGFRQSTGFLRQGSHADEVAEIGAWLRTNTAPTAIVAADLSEPVFHLYHSSRRRVMENYFDTGPFFSIVGRSIHGPERADYLLLSWYSQMKLEEASFVAFELVAQSSRSRYRLYRVGRSPQPAGDGDEPNPPLL